MHHTIELSVPSAATDEIIDALRDNADVLSIALNRGASVKPEGDVITVHVLNKGGDDVMKLLGRAEKHGPASAATSELASIADRERQDDIEQDEDEGLWEEMEAGLRHHGRVTVNFVALMALGGVAATIGLVENATAQAIAFVASAMLAPGFEPLAKVPLGLLLRRTHVALLGLKSALIGYAALVAASAVTFRVLMAQGETSALLLARNSEVRSLSLPDARSIGLSIVGGLAGMLIIAAYRRSSIAGPLILLSIIPATSLVGASLACGQWKLAMQGAERFAIDVAIIWITGAVVVWLKQITSHRKRPTPAM